MFTGMKRLRFPNVKPWGLQGFFVLGFEKTDRSSYSQVFFKTSLHEVTVRPTPLDLNLFMISLERFNGNYNILDDPSGICCVPDEGEVRNLNLFEMIVRKNNQRH